MKSKASCFSLSGPLFVENIRRYWAVMAVAFIAYFLAGVSPILINMGEPDLRRSAGYIDNLLTGQNPMFISLGFAMPIICAVIALNYMQKSASATSIHAMPFSRARLYNTSVLSGFVMTVIPYIAAVLILLLIARPTYSVYDYTEWETIGSVLNPDAKDVFTRSAILIWALESIVTSLFVYAIAIFGGIISGNGVMHSIMAVCWNWLAPALALVGVYFSGQYLYGYSADLTFITYLTPVMRTVFYDTLTGGQFAAYIIISIAVLALSAFLYGRRKLERTGEAIVFTWLKPILCCLFTLFVTILTGLYFEALGVLSDSYLSCYLGYAVGAIVGYLVARMIVFKTPKVFNVATLKGFAIYVVILIAIFAGFIFDIGGYETRVPAANKIEAAYITMPDLGAFASYDRYQAEHFNMVYDDDDIYKVNRYANIVRFKDSENIEEVRKIHSYIAEHNEFSNRTGIFESEPYEDGVQYRNVRIIYDLGGKTFERSYYIKQAEFEKSEGFAKLLSGKEFKDQFSFENLVMESIDSIQVSDAVKKADTMFTGSAAEELLAALEADFRARTFEQETDTKNISFVNIQVVYRFSEEAKKDYGAGVRGISVPLYYSDENTIAWLESHGFENVTELPTKYIRSMAIYYTGDLVYAAGGEELAEYVLEHGLHSANNLIYDSYLAFSLYPSPDTAAALIELERKNYEGTIDWDKYSDLQVKYIDSMIGEVYLPISEVPEDLLKRIANSSDFKNYGHTAEDFAR